MTSALEKTGDAISKAATQAGKAAQQTSPEETPSNPNPEQPLLGSLSHGWNTMVTNTKAHLQQAEEKMKEQQEKMKDRLSRARSAYYKRDPSLPLDVEALQDAQVVYITDRIITMGHPASKSSILRAFVPFTL